jgi:hypothetical protein
MRELEVIADYGDLVGEARFGIRIQVTSIGLTGLVKSFIGITLGLKIIRDYQDCPNSSRRRPSSVATLKLATGVPSVVLTDPVLLISRLPSYCAELRTCLRTALNSPPSTLSIGAMGSA